MPSGLLIRPRARCQAAWEKAQGIEGARVKGDKVMQHKILRCLCGGAGSGCLLSEDVMAPTIGARDNIILTALGSPDPMDARSTVRGSISSLSKALSRSTNQACDDV